MNLSSNTQSNISQTNTSIQLGVGVGVASFSSSNTPFLSNMPRQITTQGNGSNLTNSRPSSSSITIPTSCSSGHHPLHHNLHNSHNNIYRSTNINNNLNQLHHQHHHSHNIQHQNQNQSSSIDIYDSSSSSPPSSSSTSILYNNFAHSATQSHCSTNFHLSSTNAPTLLNTFNASNQANHTNTMQAQQALTLTLITATPLTTLTTTPLIPIVQQFNTSLTQTSLPSSSTTTSTNTITNTSSNSTNSLMNQLPSTSSVSSSSCSSNTCSAPSSSINRDWFTYEYKIENIEELIKSHETQQSFIQSPIFSFKNHLVTNTSHTSDPQSTNVSSSSNSLNTKQASNWRLIFYPNGAGSDCKNFLSIFLKYLSDEPVKIQMMFSIVDNNNEDVYVKYTVNKFQKSNDWGFKQLIHKNAILFQKEKFLKHKAGLLVRVKMRLDEHRHDYIKKLNDNLHYCKLLSENFSQYYYNNSVNNNNNNNLSNNETDLNNNSLNSNNSSIALTTTTTIVPNTISLPSSSSQPSNSSNSSSSTSSSQASASSNLSSPINKTNSINSSTNSSTSVTNCNSSYFDILLLVKSNESNNSTKNCICSELNLNFGSKQKRNMNTNDLDYYNSPAKRTRTDLNNKSNDNDTNINNNNFSFNNNCSKCGGNLITHQHDDCVEFIEFRAHKCILAARSPVFKAMFNYKLKENLTNKVIIEDCRPEVVKAMLKYIYTAYLPDDIRNIALDLYIAAEKYFIESLKIKCREFLVENLSLDTCIHIYILSELYNDSMLRKQSLKFINENIDKVTQNPDWNDFMSTYPQFFTNAFIRICKKDY